MTVMLLIEDNLEFLSLKGGCTGSPESTNVKMPHWWKSHATAHLLCSAVLSVSLFYFCNFLPEKELFEPQLEISNNVVFATSKGSDQPAHTSV